VRSEAPGNSVALAEQSCLFFMSAFQESSSMHFYVGLFLDLCLQLSNSQILCNHDCFFRWTPLARLWL